MAGVYQGGIQGREGTFFSFRFFRRLASQSKRRPTTDAEIDRKWAGKTVDKTRSRSRINGNEPEDQEQSAGAHCRSRKYIVVSWSMSWRTARRGETRTNQDFLSVGSRGRGGVLAGRIHLAAWRSSQSISLLRARRKWATGGAGQGDDRTFLWRGVPKRGYP